MSFVDAIRAVTLLYAALTFYMSFAIMRTFLRRKPPKLIRNHVARISLTYMSMVALTSIEVVTRWGHPLTYRAPAMFVACTFALLAQIPLLQHERHETSYQKTETSYQKTHPSPGQNLGRRHGDSLGPATTDAAD